MLYSAPSWTQVQHIYSTVKQLWIFFLGVWEASCHAVWTLGQTVANLDSS